MKAGILLFIFFALVIKAGSQIVWKGEQAFMSIGSKVEVLEDQSGLLDINKVSDSSLYKKFRRSGQSVLHFGFTNAVYWLRFRLDNFTHDSLLLELDHAFIPSADLYYQDALNTWQTTKSGYLLPLDLKPVINHAQVFSLPRGSTVCYLRIKPYVHAIPVTIWNKYKWELKADRQELVFGGYIGVLLFIILVNIFLFFALRKFYFLSYAILIFLYLCTSALVMEGYAVYLFPDIDLMFWYKVIPAFDMPALLGFCISFLQIRKYNVQLYRFTIGAVVFLFCYISSLPLIPLLAVLIINQVFALLVFVLAMRIGIVAGRNGNKLGYLFAIAYGVWFVLITVEVIYIQIGIPMHFSSISYVSTAIFVETFLLAFLLVKRFQSDKLADQQKQLEMQSRIKTMEQEFQHEILSTKLEIQTQAFNNISEEIHDNIGQVLSLIKLNINTITSPLPESDSHKLQITKSLLSKVIQDLRQLAHTLNSDFLKDIGLPKAIEQQLQIIEKTGIYICEFRVAGHITNYPQQHELLVYRVIQELLNNVIKHAEAYSITIIMEYEATRLTIKIQDNGKGFDVSQLNESPKGLGLKNMMNRLAMINGIVEIQSRKGEGTLTTIVLSADKNE